MAVKFKKPRKTKTPQVAPLEETLKEKKILIVCGSGGVGKTTVAAALALRAAEEGRKALVLTIDPAKRLANSLGLEGLGNQETLVDPAHLAREDVKIKGQLWAMMLDTKGTFDGLIGRYSPNESIRDRILENRFYKSLSTALVGSHEYMAMEKLYELYQKSAYDIIVLDTPPTKHALDFLQAPQHVTDFLDAKIFQWLIKSSLGAGKAALFSFSRGAGLILKVLQMFVGQGFVTELIDFMKNFEGMADDFQKRAHDVQKVLHAPETGFLLVTSPGAAALQEANYFYQVLLECSMPFVGFIVNRVHPLFFPIKDKSLDTLLKPLEQKPVPKTGGAEDPVAVLLPKLADNFRNSQLLARQDRDEIESFRALAGASSPFYLVDYFDFDVYDIKGLKAINQNLFSSPTRHV